MNEDLIDLLIQMGAENVAYDWVEHENGKLSFSYKGKTAVITGVWQMDGTGAISSDVSDRGGE